MYFQNFLAPRRPRGFQPSTTAGLRYYDATGALTTVWRREGTVYSSTRETPEKVLASGAQQPVIARTRSGLAIVYEKGGEIVLVLAEQSPKSLGKGRSPSVASNNHGTAFLAWEAPDGSSPLIVPLP